MEGDVVEVEEGLAGRVNVDSPGVLVEETTEVVTTTKEKREDRMVKKAEGRGDEVMTKATFKAVRDR
jgi:hypothetical protein